MVAVTKALALAVGLPINMPLHAIWISFTTMEVLAKDFNSKLWLCCANETMVVLLGL